MKYLILVGIVAVMSGLYQDAMGKKPRMSNPVGDEIIIRVSGELRIECYSEEAKLQFVFPETTALKPRSHHEILPPTGNGTYTFLRRRMFRNDAGWYACAEESMKIDDEFGNQNHMHENISWIYVYVKSNYLARLIPSRFGGVLQTVIGVVGSTVVVPCRSASPKLSFQLRYNFEDITDSDRVEFNRKIGFSMKEVSTEDDEAILQCKINGVKTNYILRSSGPKPRMITANDKDLIIQEGDELKIECYSEYKVSFMFPISTFPDLPKQSKYEIVTHQNGTNTFIRSHAISNDTGWYGCAGEGVKNAIPDYSINYTRKEIDWVYIYVNSSVPFISGPIVLLSTIDLAYDLIIACQPTSPGLHLRLSRWIPNGSQTVSLPVSATFHSRLGFVLRWHEITPGEVLYCTNELVPHISQNYNMDDFRKAVDQPPTIVPVDADDMLAQNYIIVRMAGEDIRMICEAFIPEVTFSHLQWTVPSTISKARVQYNQTWADRRFEGNMYLKGKRVMITITDLTVTDSGHYSCSTEHDGYWGPENVRYVEVFDRDGGRYVKLTRKGAAIEITGRRGKTVKWLVNLEDFPSANITWYRPGGTAVDYSNAYTYDRVKVGTRGGAQNMLFTIRELTFYEAGHHVVHVDIGNETNFINVTINVEVPPTASVLRLSEDYYKPGNHIKSVCQARGWPEPNATLSFLKCPKYPSSENCSSLYLHEFIPGSHTTGAISEQLYEPPQISRDLEKKFSTDMSGFLTCKVCNSIGCTVATKELYFSVSDKPYFTSTNLNKGRVTVNLEADTIIILECYVGGWPHPWVTWYEESKHREEIQEVPLQLKLTYYNRELRIFKLHFIEGGNRRYTCRAENKFGHVEDYIDVIIQDKSAQTEVLSTITIGVIVILLVVIIVCCTFIHRLVIKASKKKAVDLAFKNGAFSRFDPELPVVDQAELLPYDPKWEFPRALLKFDTMLGSGAFGIVKKAEARSICRGEAITTVAVKMVRSTASLNFITALSRELKILGYLGKHPNVVNLLGACTRNVFYGELFVIVEYCRFGNLRDYMLTNKADFVGQIHVVCENVGDSTGDVDCVDVKDGRFESNVEGDVGVSVTGDCGQSADITRSSEASDDCGRDEDSGNGLRSKYRGDYTDVNSEPICTRDLVYWSWQVSRAMEFLGERKIVHGDLAARNVLLADNGIVKVCDFGLAKALYKEAEYRDTGGNPLPVKWMAIESIKDQVFSYQSDIWSFGILMWELFTLGETPYPEIRNRALYQKLSDGYRMGQPKYAEITIYEMMQRCWETDPTKRPAFADLAYKLCDFLDDGFKAYYLEMHAQYMAMNAELMANGKDYLTMSLDATPASGMHEQIEMNNFTRDESRNPV